MTAVATRCQKPEPSGRGTRTGRRSARRTGARRSKRSMFGPRAARAAGSTSRAPRAANRTAPMPGVREGAQEVEREDQQRAEREQDGHRAEEHGAPGRADRLDDRVGGGAAAAELLAVAGDEEQAVVDAQPEAERDRQVDGVDADVGQAGEDVQEQEGAQDRQHPDQEREAGGDRAAEDQDQQHRGDRQGEGLGAGDVVLDGVADLAEHLRRAADADVERAGRPAVDLAQLLDAGDLLVLGAGQPGEHERLAAVAALQGRGAAARPVRHDAGHPRLAGEALRQRRSGPGRVGGVDAARGLGEQREVGGAGEEVALEDVGGAGGRRGRVLEAAGGQLGRDPAAQDPGEDEEEQREGEHAAARTDDGRGETDEHGGPPDDE